MWAMEFLMGYAFCLALGWVVLLKPAWSGFKQMAGLGDPMDEALEALGEGLKTVFQDIQELASASRAEQLAKGVLESLGDLFFGRTTQLAQDTALLMAHGPATYEAFQRDWSPHLEAFPTYPPPKMVSVLHGFWTWLQSPPVLPVLQAAGRRFGLGQDLPEERREEIRRVMQEHAPSLAHGFWYSLYCTVIFQFLLLEACYLWGHPWPLMWLAGGLVAFNVSRAVRLSYRAWQLWPVRTELRELARVIGIPDLPRFTLRILFGQALGILVMLLLLVRFLALGEALHQPGNVLYRVQQVLVWIVGWYGGMWG